MLINKFYYSALLFVSVFLGLLPWIFFDVDQGDQAYSTLHAWLLAFVVRPEMAPGYWHDSTPIWGSLYIGSLWWKIIGQEAGLLAFRLGWIALNIVTSQVLFAVFSRIYDAKKSFFAVLLSTLIVNCAADHLVITYNSAGPAMGAISFSLLCLSFSVPRNWSKSLLIFFAGFFAIITISAKLPSIPFVVLFLFLATLLHFLRTRKLGETGIFLFLFALGGLASFTILYFSLRGSHQWNMYREGFGNFFMSVAADRDEKYSKAATLARVFGHYYKIAIGGFLFLVISALLSIFRRTKQKIILGLLSLCFFLLVGSKYGVALSILIGGSILISAAATLTNYKNLKPEKLIFFFAGGLVLTAFTFGTFLDGLQNYKYGMWILFPFALLELENIKNKYFDVNKIFTFLCVSAFSIFAITRIQWPTFPYFENPIFTMQQKFQIPMLSGIYTYKEKNDSLGSLYSFLKTKGVGPGSNILAYSAVSPQYPIALIYLITKTIPPFHSPTMVEYPGSMWVNHKKVIEELAIQGKFVDYVVRQKNPFPIRQNGLFSLNPFRPQEATTSQNIPFSWEKIESGGPPNELDLIIKANRYRPIWEDNHFVVLEKY